jgi:hypothetical protein
MGLRDFEMRMVLNMYVKSVRVLGCERLSGRLGM